MFERLDQAARDVMAAAYREAISLGDNAIGTEHLLLALAAAGNLTAELPEADQLRHILASPRPQPDPRSDHAALLASLGIDLGEVRAHATRTFGGDAVARAAAHVRPRRPRRTLRSRISCSTPQPSRRCDSPLAGQQLGIIPRVKRLLERATRDARPGLVTPNHLLLALLTGNEPAAERLTALGVDIDRLVVQTRRAVHDSETGGQRAG